MIHLLPVRWRVGLPRLESHRQLVCAWLEANGVDPKHVYEVEVRGRRIHVHEYRTNADGKRHMDRSLGKVAVRHYSVRLRTEPPTLILETT